MGTVQYQARSAMPHQNYSNLSEGRESADQECMHYYLVCGGCCFWILPTVRSSGQVCWSPAKPVKQVWWYAQIVLATGSGNRPAVRVCISKTDLFGSKPVQKRDTLTREGSNPDTHQSSRRFRQVWIDPSVPIYCSAFRVSPVLSLSDKVPIIVQYWDLYLTLYLQCLGHLSDRNEQTHAPYLILKMSVNGASVMVGHVSWVLWRAMGLTQSQT